MIEAAFWGLAGGAGLLLGAVAGARADLPPRAIGAAMALGAGVLISAFAFLLNEKAYELGGGAAATSGVVTGAVLFFAVDRIHDRRDRELSALGPILNSVPGTMAIALTLVEDGDIGGAVLVAVFLSNIALALAAGAALRPWAIVVVAAGLVAGLTYGVLESAPDTVVAVIQAAAIGAALCMAVDKMLPVAFQQRSPAVGLFTVIGFGAGFGLSIA